MATLFGWKFEDQVNRDESNLQAFSPPDVDDGSAVVGAAGVYGTYLNLDNTFTNEFDLMARYRSMSMQPECELAIDEIVNESIISGRRSYPVSIELDYLEDYSEMLKEKIGDEFYLMMDKLNFKYMGYEIFRKWFIDGRLFYQVLIDVKNPQKGILELRPIDPFKIKKIRERKKTDEETAQIGLDQVKINQEYNDYYLYSETGVFNLEGQGDRKNILKISPDSIIYVNSGLLDERRKSVVSYLHKAFRPMNQIRMLEDAAIIYRLSRAPSRRVFYVDVGNLPKAKAEQYMHSLMNQYRNKMVYDSKTGQLRDDRKFQAMLEDYWMPRRNGSATTEIDTIQGSEANFTQLDELEFFQRQLFRSLNVPISRMQPEAGFSLGRASEISREEYKFLRFVERLRTRFSNFFLEILKRQLILKNVVSQKQWDEISDSIHFTFDQDSNFNSLKDLELLTEKMNVLRDAEEHRGKYFSANYIRKNVLNLSDEDIERIDEEIEQEKYDPRFAPQEGDMGMGMGGGMGGGLGGGLGGDLGGGLGSDLGGLGDTTTPSEPTGSGMTNDLGGAGGLGGSTTPGTGGL